MTTTGRLRVLGSRDVDGALDVEDVDTLLTRLRPGAARTDPLLVVAPAAQAERARRTLSLARAGAPGATGVVHASTLPPLARAALLEAVSELPSSFSAGQLLVACEAIERATIAGAVLGSLTRLAQPAPRMAQHLASWWPPNRFIVLTHPHPQIVRGATGLEQLHLPPTGAPLAFRSTTSDVASHVVVEQLAVRLTGRGTSVVEAPEESRERWGTVRFSEFCAVPLDVSGIVHDALAAATPCRSCGAPVVWPSCRFCHSRGGPSDAEAAEAAESAESAAPLAFDPTARGER
ncbi:hypothetical protein [Angustibacter sp. Root456]|uniref:hypothetical protein n=1 Tax=Angustibacter sp. Root456 TaxID=1736539 RepID=UPI0006FAED07|nr:hypothetical protein [Angustibacter sp. Root456]KQX65963.1 hypothetical protein ASD06_06070 [Angustibacter sp. Root456]